MTTRLTFGMIAAQVLEKKSIESDWVSVLQDSGWNVKKRE